LGSAVTVSPDTGEISGQGTEGASLRQIFWCGPDAPHWRCPACAHDEPPRAFAVSRPLCTAVTAETFLFELDTFPSSSVAVLPAGGRRLLAFSDSRAAAARLGAHSGRSGQ
jgi:hypothetical protein